ncbi:MAG: DUF397 domain-containing protein [Frankia sp.]|nr:DUF397 domain-containing protein [Frankia sp.]
MADRYDDEPSTAVHNPAKPDPTAYAAADLTWRTSSFSNGAGGMCVQVAPVVDGTGTRGVFVRDSADPDGPVLSFSEAEWRAFNDGAENGEFRF